MGVESPFRAVGLASWSRDRFVGLRTGSGGGEVVVLLTSAGSELHVNATGGILVAEVLRDGAPVPGLEASSCVPMNEDSLDHTMPWRATPLAPLEGWPVDVKTTMQHAEIFSLW